MKHHQKLPADWRSFIEATRRREALHSRLATIGITGAYVFAIGVTGYFILLALRELLKVIP